MSHPLAHMISSSDRSLPQNYTAVTYTQKNPCAKTHTHVGTPFITRTFHMRNGFYTELIIFSVP